MRGGRSSLTPPPPFFFQQVFVRDSSVVTPYALVLFGGAITVRHRKAKIALGDGWVEFEAEPRIGVLAKALRAGLHALLAQKISQPGLDIARAPVVAAITRLLIRNGF